MVPSQLLTAAHTAQHFLCIATQAFLPWPRRQTSVGLKAPCWAPNCFTPKSSLCSQKAKNHIWQNKTVGWRGPVGNSSTLIPNRIPGPRRSVLRDRPHAWAHPEGGCICFGRERVKVAHVNEKLYNLSLTQGFSSHRFVDWGIWPQSCTPELKERGCSSVSPLSYPPSRPSWNMHSSPSS